MDLIGLDTVLNIEYSSPAFIMYSNILWRGSIGSATS